MSHCLTINTITIRLPDDLRADLQRVSEEHSKPISDIVRESIRRCVAMERFRALCRKALPFDEAQVFETDEKDKQHSLFIQIGTGIATLNDTEGYLWNDFEKRVCYLLDTVFQA